MDPASRPLSHTPPAAARWRLRLLGGFDLDDGSFHHIRLASKACTALLARLAMWPHRAHGREELIELLWPGVDGTAGRNRLRHTLSTLKSLLEPVGGLPGAVIAADRVSLRLMPGVLSCDVNEFERLLRSGRHTAARSLYGGDLLPGFYDEWIVEERLRLAALAERFADTADTADRPMPATAPSPAHTPAVALEAMGRHPAEPAKGARHERLPAFVARFFGREAELAQLGQMLAAHRLVTLLGPGGSGKTRLAVELARRAAEGYAIVAFVPLAECERADELPARIRAALGLPVSAGDALESIKLFLSGRPTLIVLDNYEQLVAAGGAQLALQLLQGVPTLRFLVSSRRRLDIDGERSFEVGPLPLPEDDGDLAASALNPCIALFVDRAQGARAGFHLNARNRADIQALCVALEGVPLAIELAASRAHALSPADMRAQMQQRFSLLARRGPRAHRAPRHASLDAAIDWSWQLLSGEEQACLAALSVFREGFDAEAVVAVWGQPSAHDVLARLVADSLVHCDSGADGAMRYRLLEMVREFVAERLAPPDRLRLRSQHRDWCLALARRDAGMLPLAEVPNLYEALRSSVEDGQPQQVLALSLATESHWERRGVPPEVRALWLVALDALRNRSTLTAPWIDALHAARRLFARRLYEAGDPATAVALADEAVAEAGSDTTARARALAVQLRLRWKSNPQGDEDLTRGLHEALALTDAGSDPRTRAELFNLLGEVMVLGRRDALAALPFYAEALALFEVMGAQRQAWDVRMGQGICAQVLNRFDEAIATHAAVAEAAERLDDQLLRIDAYNNLAVACNYARRWAPSVAYAREQLRLATQQYSRYMQVMALWNLARPLARDRQPEAAAIAMAASRHEWLDRFAALAARDERYVAKVRRLVRRQLGAARADALWAQGEQMTLADAVKAVLDPLSP